ncbi:hypothetical protein CERSUDRAFT_118138 [Gelatoporia subvermispora B]|uniref:BRCT domain-containing protein n=1 Tax=Ceriporiopsis subvermispora (strain B) TaxID=914234 RepID=M2PBU1_CERS8|nr:hypothetical protein CERSUDRAFT_118138 [Gelatoporia subvermispora B]
MPVPSTSLSSSSSGASTSASTSAVTSTPHASRTSTSTVPQKRPMACSFAQPTASSVLKSTPAASSPKKARLAPAESQRPKSSLSTLSVALSKLAMPPPPRPSSAMDFNITRDADAPVAGPSNATNSHMSSQPHSGTNGMPARKAATTGNLVAMLGRRPDGPGVKKTLSMRTLTRGGPSTLGLGPFGRGAFASRGRMGLRASKQTTLPMVLGSPVKPGREDAPEDVPADAHDSDTGPQLPAVFAAAVSETDGAESNPTDDAQILADFNDSDVPSHPQLAGASQDAASDARRAAHHARSSRRASLASQLLSQSIAGHPHTPPTLPPGPMTSSGGAKENAVLAADGLPNGAQSAPAALTRTRGAAARVSAHGRSAEASPAQGAGDSGTGPLTVLSDCTIFVDVRTDDGDDAGSLFVDMLRGMGAKVLQRVGQTCTHIVYKNGLMSTITRYRLLHEPRPLVVGIAWVVECAEQRTHVDETKFLITLDGVNVAGTNKRRRSMLPKSLGVDPEATGTPPQQSYSPAERSTEHVGAADVFSSQVPADVTMEESREGAADVGLDSLPPLEKARRRKSLLFGPHAMHH